MTRLQSFLHAFSYAAVAFQAVDAVPMPQASTASTSTAAASTASVQPSPAAGSSSSYWLASIKHQGTVAFGDDSSYQIFRNVQTDGGAKGDGITDDFAAINTTMFSGNRCGLGCDSSTTTPALVYFPPGTYLISQPIVMPYYTQMIGDPLNPPKIIPTSDFQGIALVDADPYIQGVSNPDGTGINYYTNQNNFFRQVRNFVLDISSMGDVNQYGSGPAALHWQVAQATSLQNIVFNMKPASSTNKQQGIYMENGSGGFFSDLTFNGGGYGMFLGNQQFTSRNLTFNNCGTAIYMNWNWLWTFKSLNINGGNIGIDMSSLSGNGTQQVSSVMVMDSTIGSTVGIKTSRNQTSIPTTGGTLIVQNVDFTGSTAIAGADGTTSILAGGQTVAFYAQGDTITGSASGPTNSTTGPTKAKRFAQAQSSPADSCAGPSSQPMANPSSSNDIPMEVTTGSTSATTASSAPVSSSTVSPDGYTNSTAPYGNSTSPSNSTTPIGTCSAAPPSLQTKTVQQQLTGPSIPSILTNSGSVFERSKPQYEDVPVSSFVSVKASGAAGDGTTDDSDAIQQIFDNIQADQVVFFDHGAYRITKTINVPSNIRMVGEIWPLIMADGTSSSFSDINNPQPVWRIGNQGQQGTVEISDLIFETIGPAPGAIMMEWNIEGETQGAAGMWDTHFRIGGTAGTQLETQQCAGNVTHPIEADPSCIGAFMLLHITQTASAYVENSWGWVADHNLDGTYNKLNIYNGRGLYVESQGAVWLYGTAMEHSQLYNYNFANAKNVFMGAIQTETAYMQSKPDALNGGFTPNSVYSDPTFADCTDESCKKTWGVIIQQSQDIYMMGAGLYSFFDDYSQTCLLTEDCQDNMVDIDACSSDIYLWGLTTKASVNMVTLAGQSAAVASEHKNFFGQTLAIYSQ